MSEDRQGSVPRTLPRAAVWQCQRQPVAAPQVPGSQGGLRTFPCRDWDLPWLQTLFLEPQSRWVSQKSPQSVKSERGSCEAAQQLGVQSFLSDSPAWKGNFPLFYVRKRVTPNVPEEVHEAAGFRGNLPADINASSCRAFPLGRSSRAQDPFHQPRLVSQSCCPTAVPLLRSRRGTKLGENEFTGH